MITSGALFGTIGLVVILLVLAGIGIGLHVLGENELDGIGMGTVIIGTIVSLVVYCILMWPFKTEYHIWQETNGSITQIERRMISVGNGGMQEVFPLKLTGHKDVYRVDDSRAATFKIGDEVKLLCKREYDFAGYDGWTCKIGEM